MGEWSGVRTSLADHGVTFGATYTHDASSVLAGAGKLAFTQVDLSSSTV